MKILVYGAGPLGSLFAARLHEGGHEVALLARGQRLADLREQGIVLVNTQTGAEAVARPRLVERLDPEDAYDLVLVIMRKNRALEILPTLAANHHSPNILFFMNNAAGPEELVKALGQRMCMFRSLPVCRSSRSLPISASFFLCCATNFPITAHLPSIYWQIANICGIIEAGSCPPLVGTG